METINGTIVFASKEAFEKAVFDALRKENPVAFNGVSLEFAEEHPNYEANNQTNSYCWNCEDCVNCVGCNDCSNCVMCVNCKSCYACVRCEKCKDTRYSVSCENLNNSLNCHFVQYFEFHEVGQKNRMDEPVYYYFNKYGKKECFIHEEEANN
jgi:hypothetical protein